MELGKGVLGTYDAVNSRNGNSNDYLELRAWARDNVLFGLADSSLWEIPRKGKLLKMCNACDFERPMVNDELNL